MRAPLDPKTWPPDGSVQRIFENGGMVFKYGTARCLFFEPTDEALALIRRDPETAFATLSGDELMKGPNIYSCLWEGKNLRDQLKLKRLIADRLREGACFATHAKDAYDEWRKIGGRIVQTVHHGGVKCQQQQCP
jgi:hypothetical protein